MKQEGFSSILIIILSVIFLGIVTAGYIAYTNSQEDVGITDASDQTDEEISSSTSQRPLIETSGKNHQVAKNRFVACSLISLDKISSITGVEMTYTTGSADQEYEDNEVWTSTCSFVEKNGTIESNAGVLLVLTGGVTVASKKELKKLYEEIKEADGGVNITGFGDDAFKIGAGTEDFSNYYVMVGDIMVWAYSAIGHGAIAEGGMPVYEWTEQTDADTEALLKHVLPQLD